MLTKLYGHERQVLVDILEMAEEYIDKKENK
jgi:hypothetical protein